MPPQARFATVHWLRFPRVMTPDDLSLAQSPEACLGPDLDLARVIDFRVHVDRVHEWLQSAEGRMASQVFTPHTVGDDGVTMSLWRSDAAMTDTMYRPGFHRTQIERHRRENLADRTSFTRFRVLQTRGRWNGSDPFELARGSGSMT